MRLLLILCLASGLAPGLGEIAESAVHLAAAGHLAHSAADGGDLGDLGHEHGCGTTQHTCGCCASQAVAVAHRVVVGAPVQAVRASRPRHQALASLHEPAPPFRPPIAS